MVYPNASRTREGGGGGEDCGRLSLLSLLRGGFVPEPTVLLVCILRQGSVSLSKRACRLLVVRLSGHRFCQSVLPLAVLLSSLVLAVKDALAGKVSYRSLVGRHFCRATTQARRICCA